MAQPDRQTQLQEDGATKPLACVRFRGEPCDPANCCGGRDSNGKERKLYVRQQTLNELRAVVRGLEDASKLPCIYDGDLDCPDAWPTDKLGWCLPCYAKNALRV